MSRILSALALLCLSIPSASPAATQAQQPELLVFAAASLTNALQDIAAAYQKTTGVRVRMSFDSSSNLAHQIEAGAPADVFFSADTEWMAYLESRQRIQAATRHDALGNQLVLIAPAGSQVKLRIAPHFPLA